MLPVISDLVYKDDMIGLTDGDFGWIWRKTDAFDAVASFAILYKKTTTMITVNNVTNSRRQEPVAITLESEGLVENLSLFSPFESNKKTVRSAVATANFWPFEDQHSPTTLAAPS